VYLGLAEVRLPDEGPAEPLVVMRRMPAERRLAQLVVSGAPVRDPLRGVARLLAAVHAKAPRHDAVVAEGTRDALRSRWEASFAQVAELGEADGAPAGVSEIERLVRRYLEGRERLFVRRIEEDRIVDGHGDLLADDIFCLHDGPRVLDCLEFDDRLRYVDGLDDAAFLAMDLERLGAPESAAFFLARYCEYSGDPAPPSLYHHYVAYRAFVRAKVGLFRARQGASGAPGEAHWLIKATLRHLRTSAVGLILVGGLPASGKSTLSGALADRLGITLLSSDRLRKELAGIPPESPAPAEYGRGLYSREWTRRTYGTLLDHASVLLESGESVVLDATWISREHRKAAAALAQRVGADLVQLRCEVPADQAATRLSGRAPGAPGVSDADAAVAATMASKEEPWPEAVAIDTSGPLDAAVGRAVAAARPFGTEQAAVFRRPYMEPD
jgi:aminoglycoside phosphotransferase family enzyme/predicted kinase